MMDKLIAVGLGALVIVSIALGIFRFNTAYSICMETGRSPAVCTIHALR